MPTGYLLTALWGGQDGSLLWWLFLLSVNTTACVAWMRNRWRELQPYVIATLMAVMKFFVLIMVQRFFGDASYAIIGPYLAEVWPNRLRASGMGFSYGIGNLGKIIGPLGLALVIGTSDYVSPKATVDAIFPALLFLAFWYGQAALVFLFFGIEISRFLGRFQGCATPRLPLQPASFVPAF